MQDDFELFLIEPTRANYERVREALLADAAFHVEPLDLLEAEALCAGGEFAAARERIEGLLYDWALSPRVHFLAAWAAAELADAQDAAVERFAGRACLAGLLATGDGSFACPYLVTYTTDEYDLLGMLGREARSTQLIDCDSGRFDVLHCTDGSELWFDVTDLFRQSPAPRHPLVRTSA